MSSDVKAAWMYIGELAQRGEISVQAIRLYERRGLMPKPARSASGYRQYTENDLEIIRTIKKCKHFGFLLEETRRILALYLLPDEKAGKKVHSAGSHSCLEEIVGIAATKLQALNNKIRELTAIRDEIEELMLKAREQLRDKSHLPPRTARIRSTAHP